MVIPGSLPLPITLNASPTVNTLNLGAGSTLHIMSDPTVRGSITNHGLIDLSTAGYSSLSLGSASSSTFEWLGSGELHFDSDFETVTGPVGQLVRHGPDHTIRGAGSLAVGTLNFINQGLVEADLPGQILRIRPYSSFLNDGGILRATNGGILELGNIPNTTVVFTSQNGGQLVADDDSEVRLRGSETTLQGIVLQAGDTDGNLTNNVFGIAPGEMKLQNCANEANLVIGGGAILKIKDSFIDNGLISFGPPPPSIDGTLFIADNGGDHLCHLDGTGALGVGGTNKARLDGDAGVALVVGSNYTWTVNGAVGLNHLVITNRGTFGGPDPHIVTHVDTYMQTPFVNEGDIYIAGEGTNFEGEISLNAIDSALLLDGPGGYSIMLINEGSITISSGSALGLHGGNATLLNRGTIESAGIWSVPRFDQEAGYTHIEHAGNIQGYEGYDMLHDFDIKGGEFDLEDAGLTRSDVYISGTGVLVAKGPAGVDGDPIPFLIGNRHYQDPGIHFDGGAFRAVIVDSNSTNYPIGLENSYIVDTSLLLSGDTSLQISYLGDATSISPTDTIPIEYFAFTNILNVPDGGRLTSLDGKASFKVTYNPATLSEFQYHNPPLPDQPPVVSRTNYTIPENIEPAPPYAEKVIIPPVDGGLVTGEGILRFKAYDPEGVPVTYALVGNGPFKVFPNTGNFITTGYLNYESTPVYHFDLVVSANGLTTTQAITINVTDVVEQGNQMHVTDLLAGPGKPFEGETDPNIIGMGADPDMDGIANIFELWLGTDPSVSNSLTGLFPVVVNDSGTDYGALEVDVVSAVDDLLDIGSEASFDLQSWRDTSGNRTVLSDNAGVRRLRFRDTVPLADPYKFFFRLRAGP